MYRTSVNDTEFAFHDDRLMINGMPIYYTDMRNVTVDLKQPPAFKFTYEDRTWFVPYSESEFEIIHEYFTKAASASEKAEQMEKAARAEAARQQYQQNNYSNTQRSGSYYQQQNAYDNYPVRQYEKHLFVWLYTFLLGVFGADRFARGQIGLGILKFITFGFGGFWFLADWIIAMTKAYGNTLLQDDYLRFDKQGRYIC